MKFPTKSVFKWAGGKKQLLPALRKKIVEKGLHTGICDGSISYIEPFIGGGALFFDLQPGCAWINDINQDLIFCYQFIRDEPLKFIQAFNTLCQTASASGNLAEFYYKLREFTPKLEPAKHARFYYLNKTCFNGLYRVNKDGLFNVPFNKSSKVPTLDVNNLINVSELLRNVSVTNIDSLNLLQHFSNEKPHFFYLDPPYVPVKQNSFVGYTSTIEKDFHEKLATLAYKLALEGHYVMMSNSNCQEVHRLYRSHEFYTTEIFQVNIVSARESINSVGAERKRTETIITNF